MIKFKESSEIDKMSNLITDMTLNGASTAELEQAIQHSMAVIDDEKRKQRRSK